MEYKIGDKVKVATRIFPGGAIMSTDIKIMEITKVHDRHGNPYYSFNNNNNIQYPNARIVGKVTDLIRPDGMWDGI